MSRNDRRRVTREKPVRKYDPPQRLAYNSDQAAAWLEDIKRDEWWITQMPISKYALREALGLQDIISALRRPSERQKMLLNIARLIPDIENRKLVFPFQSCVTVKIRGIVPKFLWLEPPAQPPQIRPLTDGGSWSLWARCQVCAGNKFMPLIGGDVACWSCIKPSQYRGLRTMADKRSLIHEALKKYY